MAKYVPPKISYRIHGPRRRAGGGMQQQYLCVINDIPLRRGFMAESKRNGVKEQYTVFGLEVVPGWDWHWLAEKNGKKYRKPEAKPPVEQLAAVG